MSRHIACLTFDFDAMSGFVARGMTTPTLISRGEFGNVGAQRVLGLLARYEIPATWFIPGVVIGTYRQTCEQIVAAGHEIAHHGWTHRPPASLEREQEATELARGNQAITTLTGQPAKGYRSPSWDLSPHTIDLLLEHGFKYDTSMMAHDCSPYFARTGDRVHQEEPIEFGEPTALVEMPISWSLDDHPHYEYWAASGSVRTSLRNANSVLENWVDDFVYMTQTVDWGVLTYTCHPYVIGRGHRMLMLERLIKALREHGAVFTTMESALNEFMSR